MSDKVILKKVIGIGTENFQGALTKRSPFLYELVISELKHSNEKQEFKEKERQTVREQKIRPLNDGSLGASEVIALQKKIDKYLEKNTVDDALIVIPAKGKKPAERQIEVDLKFPVERWIDEGVHVVEVPVMRNVPKVDEKKIATIPFYFRPSSGQINKSVQNFIKHKNV